MSHPSVCALVLAGGKGTRMHSSKPKVLHELLGEPMLHYVYRVLEDRFADSVHTVVGFGREQVAAAFPQEAQRFVVQERQLGTGHALQVAWDAVAASGCEFVLVINGDTPLIRRSSLESFLDAATGADVAFMTISLRDPGAFGRVVRDPEGHVSAIVEAKDYDIARHGVHTGEVNAGVYLLRVSAVGPLLPLLTNENRSGEYYITDLVDLAVGRSLCVLGHHCGSDPSLMGVNSPAELVAAEETLRAELVRSCLERGVLIHHGSGVVLGPRAELAPGAEIHGPCELLGATVVEAGAVVRAFCHLRDSRVGPGSRIRPYSHLEGAEVGPGCVVGPHARLRPGAKLAEGARVGNFCEIKKAEVGPGSKVNHLTYVGDAVIGAGVNIGAGTITCNYDGKNKFLTTIKDGAFIGSNTALVAPVTVGERVVVGAGSVITKDVPDGDLAVARARQTNLAGRGKS
jgi:bifunctional UDP-N-acetylglucosamine pyrophosphorylase/glucosamine-1-phosphate N-acetyltransferase